MQTQLTSHLRLLRSFRIRQGVLHTRLRQEARRHEGLVRAHLKGFVHARHECLVRAHNEGLVHVLRHQETQLNTICSQPVRECLFHARSQETQLSTTCSYVGQKVLVHALRQENHRNGHHHIHRKEATKKVLKPAIIIIWKPVATKYRETKSEYAQMVKSRVPFTAMSNFNINSDRFFTILQRLKRST